MQKKVRKNERNNEQDIYKWINEVIGCHKSLGNYVKEGEKQRMK